MSDLVVDSCVVVKWVLPEPDRDKALQLFAQASASGDRLYVVDIALAEVANAIWKRQHRGMTSAADAQKFLLALQDFPLNQESSAPLIAQAYYIAVKYDRSLYDALFVALTQTLGLQGVTADEPLFNAVHRDFPQIALLRSL